MPADAKTLLVDTLEFVHKVTRDLLRDFPDDRLTHQPGPTDNHVMWTVGHLASVNDWFASLIDGKPVAFRTEWQPLFGYKSAPSTERGKYPAFDQVVVAMETSFARLLAAVRAQSGEDLAKACQAESHGLAPTRADAASRAAWHEGWHGGQIAGIRKGLGLGNVM